MEKPEPPDDEEMDDAINELLADDHLDDPETIHSSPEMTFKRAVVRAFFLIGVGMLASAFIAAVSEAIISRTSNEHGWFISAHDLWRELRPESLLMAQFMVKKHIADWLWEPVITGLLGLPAWLLFGGPGMLLVWKCHPHGNDGEEFDEDSLYLYDRLAEAARNEGYEDDIPQLGRITDEDGDAMIDTAGATTLQSPDEFANEWSNPDYGDAGIPKR